MELALRKLLHNFSALTDLGAALRRDNHGDDNAPTRATGLRSERTVPLVELEIVEFGHIAVYNAVNTR